MINTRNGTSLWKIQNNTEEDITTGSFIKDQNNDTIADILAVHTNLAGELQQDPVSKSSIP